MKKLLDRTKKTQHGRKLRPSGPFIDTSMWAIN